ncbi:MAG: hypothetical protein H8E62_03840 [Planctomycetes bacterium]|nr:hypothetical protein [Planctomycetota bacterium]
MRKSVLSCSFVVLGVLFFSGAAWAFESVSVDVTADFNSKYIWRGQVINDDYAFQPGIGVTLDSLTLGIWGSLDLTDYTGNNSEFIEYDYYADYTTSIAEGIDLSVGVINYYFPSAEDTTEVYCGFAFDLPLSPSVTAYFDVDDVKGTYVSFGVGHSFEKIAELSSDMPIGMELGASLGWGSKSYNKAYWGAPATSSALNDLALSVAFPVGLGNWTVSPSFNYVTLVDNDVRKSDSFDKSSDYFFTGISLSTSF